MYNFRNLGVCAAAAAAAQKDPQRLRALYTSAPRSDVTYLIARARGTDYPRIYIVYTRRARAHRDIIH